MAEALLKELKQTRTDPGASPLVNMKEDKDCIKIEMIIPGVRREDIFIHVQDSILSIMVLHMACENVKKEMQVHEFDTRCLERHIVLPENADTEFVSAEYRHGILCLQISKAKEPAAFKSQKIVVY